MPKRKEQRFNVIGQSYEKANKLFPESRTDADKVLELLNLQGWESVFETTCGTGFLTEKISENLPSGSLISHDISKVMLDIAKKKIGEEKVKFLLSKDPKLSKVPSNSIDKAVCLGGFHHVEKPIELLKTIKRILRPGGQMVVGDFADHSGVQRYFDERINEIASTGHCGFFLSESKMVNYARLVGLSVKSIETVKTPFNFNSREEIGKFFQLVHGLDQDPQETLQDIEKYIGVKKSGNIFTVPMDYVYVVYKKEG